MVTESKGGRPELPPEQRKSKRVIVALTPPEMTMLEALARTANKKPGEMARDVLIDSMNGPSRS